MGSIKTTVQLVIKSSNPFEAKAKMLALKALSELDNDALTKLGELAKNPTAVAQLKANFEVIRGFIN